MRCPYCSNGVIPAGYNYLSHQCTDCEGTGQLSECEDCGVIMAGDHEVCDECQEKRDELEEDEE